MFLCCILPCVYPCPPCCVDMRCSAVRTALANLPCGAACTLRVVLSAPSAPAEPVPPPVYPSTPSGGYVPDNAPLIHWCRTQATTTWPRSGRRCFVQDTEQERRWLEPPGGRTRSNVATRPKWSLALQTRLLYSHSEQAPGIAESPMISMVAGWQQPRGATTAQQARHAAAVVAHRQVPQGSGGGRRGGRARH